MTESSTDILSTEQVAQILGVKIRYVQRLCRDPELKFGRKVGSAWIITREELDAFIANRRPPGRPRRKGGG